MRSFRFCLTYHKNDIEISVLVQLYPMTLHGEPEPTQPRSTNQQDRAIIVVTFQTCHQFISQPSMGQQGWRSGESAHLPPMWPGFDSQSRCHMWVEFVVGSHPCSERFFSGYSGFPLSSKTNISKFQFDLQSPRLVVHLCTAIRLRL